MALDNLKKNLFLVLCGEYVFKTILRLQLPAEVFMGRMT